MIDKKGRSILVYMHVFPCFIHKGGERFLVYAYCFVLQKGEKNLMSFMLDWHVYLLMHAFMFVYVYVLHCHIYLFIVMHELRGSFFEALL